MVALEKDSGGDRFPVEKGGKKLFMEIGNSGSAGAYRPASKNSTSCTAKQEMGREHQWGNFRLRKTRRFFIDLSCKK